MRARAISGLPVAKGPAAEDAEPRPSGPPIGAGFLRRPLRGGVQRGGPSAGHIDRPHRGRPIPEPALAVYVSQWSDANSARPPHASNLVVADGERQPGHTLTGRLLTEISQTDRLQNRGEAARQIRPNELGTARNPGGIRCIDDPRGPYRSLHRLDNLLQSNLSGCMSQNVAPAGPSFARNEPRPAKSLKNLLEIARRDLLTISNDADLDRLATPVISEVKQATDRIVDLERKAHAGVKNA